MGKTDLNAVKPCPRYRMEEAYDHGENTLCSTIREIYLKSTDPEIKLLARIAYRMGKNFSNVLYAYRGMLEARGVYLEVTKEDWHHHGSIGKIVEISDDC